MNIILGQIDVAWEDRQTNFARLSALLANQPPRPQSLLVLPEMFSVGFSMNLAATAEEAPQPTRTFLIELAAKYAIYVIGGIVSRAIDGRGLNQAVVISPTGAEITRYTKIHPFSFANENVHFDGGTEIVTFSTEEFTVAPFICYDLRFPEVFRHAVRAGANVLVVIANWPTKRSDHWLALLQARAIENLAYVIGVNRVGTGLDTEYSGRSLVIDPHGKILLDAGGTEKLAEIEIDPKELTQYRKSFPALQDIRPGYLGLAK